MHPGILILAGALLGLMDVRNSTKDKASEADTLRDDIERLRNELAEAQTSLDTGRIGTLEAELDAARRELRGLRAGKAAREAKPPKPKRKPVQAAQEAEPEAEVEAEAEAEAEDNETPEPETENAD